MLQFPIGFYSSPPTIGGELWTPADLTSEALAWWNATIGVADTSDVVDTWTDQTSNAVVATSDGVNVGTNVTTQNGLNVLDFNADKFNFGSISLVKSMIVVCGDLNGSDSNATVSSIIGNSGGNDHTFVSVNGADGSYDLSIDGSSGNSGNASWEGNTLTSGGNIDLGNTTAQNEGWGVWYADYNTPIIIANIGSILTSYKLKGKIGELLLLDYVPTEAERDQLFGYACHRWGLTANMPAGHTYKSAAPTTTPPPTLWSPTDLAVAPHAWWDATIGVADTANAVDTWTDQGTLAKVASPIISAWAPATNTSTQNGLNVLHFNDDAVSFTPELTGIKAVMIICGELDGSAEFNLLGAIHGSSGQSDYTYINCNSADSAFDVSMNGSNSNTGNASWEGNTLTSGGDIDMGLTNAQCEGWGVWYVDYDVAVKLDFIGAAINGGSYKLRGKIAELIFLDYVPTLDERERLTGYACHKWGLTADMPVGHTYKSAAPTT